MRNPLRFFITDTIKPLLQDSALIDEFFKKIRISVMLANTFGYGFAYTCRLGLSVVKKSLIDGELFSADQLGIIHSALFYASAFDRLSNGFLADHSNLKRFFSFGLLVSAVISLDQGLGYFLGPHCAVGIQRLV
jgi:OPA family sugar phosphate sensor protein UhpC-like MFS transporter